MEIEKEFVPGEFQSAILAEKNTLTTVMPHRMVTGDDKPRFSQGTRTQRELAQYLEAARNHNLLEFCEYLSLHPQALLGLDEDSKNYMSRIKQTSFSSDGEDLVAKLKEGKMPTIHDSEVSNVQK